MKPSLLGAAAVVLALGLLGCSERRPSGSIAFWLSSRHVAPPGPAAPASPTTSADLPAAGDSALVALGRDSIIMRRVELVLKDVQLAPTESGECEPGEEEHCAALEPGPVLIALPLGDLAEHITTVRAAADTFIGFHFAIHRPDSSQDGPFLAAHPEFANTSIRVAGTFSRRGARRDFVYTTDFSEREEGALHPPLIVLPGATANVTFRLNVAGWFITADKTALIDPATANRGQPNQTLVQDNIRTSVAAFRDDDHDGRDDDNAAALAPVSGRDAPASTPDAPTSGLPAPAPAVSPWPAHQESGSVMALLANAPGSVPRCRQDAPRLTPDSIGPFRLEQTLSELQRECPRFLYGWQLDPDGFPVPAVVVRLGAAITTALLTDTLPTATVRQVDVAHGAVRTAEGMGVGSTLRELQRSYGAPGASEPGCELRVWFATLPGLAFRMEFPPRQRRACGGLSEEPLPPDLRVAGVILVPS
jgi:hypothetical protein